jgi:hypothetical protein
MIDHFCRWNTEAAAKQDAMRLKKYFGIDNGSIVDYWYLHQFLPNVAAWRVSQDFHDTAGNLEHVYLTGWFGILALDQAEPIILTDTCCAFALDRNGPPYIVKNNIGTVIQDVGVSPIFAGSHYPLGGWA